MNLNKSLEFFNPINVDAPIHVVGIGAMGSRIAELLVRLGIQSINIWDMDTVDAHNITNQLYFNSQIGMQKTEALKNILLDINPQCKVRTHGEWKDNTLGGYIFLCVDNIELRKQITEKCYNSEAVKGMFDCRMRLTDAQSYGANWKDEQQKKVFLNSMDFSHEEAKDATPVSACGTTLSVASTVVSTASFTVSNFMNLINTGECASMIFTDAFAHTIMKY